MGFSHNVLFEAVCGETDEFPHPPGEPLMRELAAAMQAAGWETSEINAWRGGGALAACLPVSVRSSGISH